MLFVLPFPRGCFLCFSRLPFLPLSLLSLPIFCKKRLVSMQCFTVLAKAIHKRKKRGGSFIMWAFTWRIRVVGIDPRSRLECEPLELAAKQQVTMIVIADDEEVDVGRETPMAGG